MDRPIVVSARRYYPPGDRRLSRYHLYRCTSEGKHWVQLTNDTLGDYRPIWSPHGRWIFFQRVEKSGLDFDSLSFGEVVRVQLCLIHPDGSGFLTLPLPQANPGVVTAKWMGSRYLWIQSNQLLSLLDIQAGKYIKRISDPYDDGNRNFDFSPNMKCFSLGGKIYDLKTGKIIIRTNSESLLFMGNDRFLTFSGVYNMKNEEMPGASLAFNYDSDDFGGGKYLSSIDRKSKRFVWIKEIIKAKWYSRGTYHGDLVTGVVRTYDMGWDPVFSPDGLRFIGPGERGPTPYGTRPNGAPRAVMTVPLVGGVVGKSYKILDGGLIEVDSCDWRGRIGA